MIAPTPAQVHAMCAYLRTSNDLPIDKCMQCPARIDSPYGPGQPGCYAIAAETLAKSAEILEG